MVHASTTLGCYSSLWLPEVPLIESPNAAIIQFDDFFDVPLLQNEMYILNTEH